MQIQTESNSTLEELLARIERIKELELQRQKRYGPRNSIGYGEMAEQLSHLSSTELALTTITGSLAYNASPSVHSALDIGSAQLEKGHAKRHTQPPEPSHPLRQLRFVVPPSILTTEQLRSSVTFPSHERAIGMTDWTLAIDEHIPILRNGAV